MRGSLPQGEQKARAVRGMFDAIASRYDLVNRVMTFGLDVGWRRRTARSLGLAPGALVLDLACGTGDLCREVMRSGLRAIGFDFSMGMLAAARTEAPLVLADILTLPVRDGSADGITCGFALRNVVDLEQLFAEMARALHPGGRIGLLEVSEPRNALMRRGHHIYFNRVVPLIGAILSDHAAYSYLPRSVAYLPDEPQILQMLRKAGFLDARKLALSRGIAQLLVGTRA